MPDVYPVYLELGWKHCVSSVSRVLDPETHYPAHQTDRQTLTPSAAGSVPHSPSAQLRANIVDCFVLGCRRRGRGGGARRARGVWVEDRGWHRVEGRETRDLRRSTPRTPDETREIPCTRVTVYLAVYLVCICFRPRNTCICVYLYPYPCVSGI